VMELGAVAWAPHAALTLAQGLEDGAAGVPLPPARPEEAGPAADLLFDVFAFAFSPGGLVAVAVLISLGFAWDYATAAAGKTLLGQEYDRPESSRFMIRFTSAKDGFFEAPSGGAERVEAGASYVEEFDEYAGCIALARALDRSFGKGVVRYQTFEMRGSEFIPRNFASATAAASSGKAGSGKAATKEGGGGKGGTEGADDIDAKWKKYLEGMRLTSSTSGLGLDGVEVNIITPEKACRLCNGKGFRGCSSCSTPARAQGPSEEGDLPNALSGGAGKNPGCGTCQGEGVVRCEWCGGGGEQPAQGRFS